MEGAALTQSCVSPKTADQKVSRIGTDPSRWSLDTYLDIIYHISCPAVHKTSFKSKKFKSKRFKDLLSLLLNHSTYKIERYHLLILIYK